MSRILPFAKQSIVFTLTAALLTTSLFADEQEAKTTNKQLLLPRPDTEMKVNRPVHAINLAYAKLNFELLDQMTTGSTFEIELAGNQYEGFVEEAKTQMYGRTINGFLAETPGSFFTITVVNDAAAGTFFVPGKRMIRLRYGGDDDLHYLHEVATNRNMRCDVGEPPSPPLQVNNAGARATPVEGRQQLDQSGLGDDSNNQFQQLLGDCVPPPPTFDIMLVYTGAARLAAGGQASIRAECINAVEITEFTYSTCSLSIQTNIVWLAEVNYDENGTFTDHLARLIGTTDGILDQIHGQRNIAAADFVGLVVNDTSACGLGTCVADESNAMSANYWGCIADNFTLAHEMGHNIGLNHDPANRGGCSPIPNAFGHTFFEGILQYRTVMASLNAGGDRIPYYSSPNCQFSSSNTGTPSRNNRSVIFDRQNIYESFRLTRMDVFVDSSASGSQNGSFQNPFDTVLEGVNRTLPNPVADLPELHIDAGFYDESLVITKPMIIRSCGGTATIGQ